MAGHGRPRWSEPFVQPRSPPSLLDVRSPARRVASEFDKVGVRKAYDDNSESLPFLALLPVSLAPFLPATPDSHRCRQFDRRASGDWSTWSLA